MPSPSCTGVALAGGACSRYGGELKGLLPLGDRRIVDRVLDALGASCDEMLIVANDPAIRRAMPGVPVYGDVGPERGSLIGLYSGVSHARDAALTVAWDMPFVSPELLRELREIGEAHAAAVLPEGPRGPEPLCAYYPASSAPVIQRQIASGIFRLGALVDVLPGRIVLPLDDVARFGDPERLFVNINTPRDLERAGDMLHSEKYR
jgi:molybdopterin-guanine dinucleotide biosynthesis protein A